MRFAVDASVLEPPCPTGVERAAAGIVEALPEALGDGDEAFVLSRGELPPPRSAHARVRRIAIGGPEAPLVWREASLAPALADLRADALWSPVTAIPLATRVPRVATFHEAPWLVRRGMEGFLRARAHALRLRIAVQTAARIVCPSEAAAAQVRQIHADAAPLLRVVPHAVDDRFLAARDEGSEATRRAALGLTGPYLLQVGGFRPRKNVPHLLSAYARFRLRGGKADLVVAGPGSGEARLPRGVRAVGWVDDPTLLALYDGATALVLASESEGFGIPVLEAFARGVPVVACSAGGVPEAAAGAALLVSPGDAEALATALLRVEAEPSLRALLVERGRRRAAGARWCDATRRLLEILREAAHAQ